MFYHFPDLSRPTFLLKTFTHCYHNHLVAFTSTNCQTGWQRGVLVTRVRRMNEVDPRRAWLILGWVTVFGRVYAISVCNQPTRSTQPCIPPGSLNRVPALLR